MENYSFDLHRIFIGDLPLLFLVEIALRVTVMYIYTIIAIRLAPRRSISNVTPLEMLIIIALGSAMGDPMFYPDVPLIHGLLVITLVLVLHVFISYLTRRGDMIEGIIEGDPIRVVVDGMLDTKGMAMAQVTREDVFTHLRVKEFEHLGEVEAAYVETNGQVSARAFAETDKRPGFQISLSPEKKNHYSTHDTVPQTRKYVCNNCGYVRNYTDGETFIECPRCEHNVWTDKVIEPAIARLTEK